MVAVGDVCEWTAGLAGTAEPRVGLTGMRERVAALGGWLEDAAGPGGTGLAVTTRLPCRDSAPAGTQQVAAA